MGSAKEIEMLLGTSIDKLQKVINVNTIVGDMVSAGPDVYVVPVSKVVCAFGAGGGEYGTNAKNLPTEHLPFGGGAGAGMSVQPVGFLIIREAHVQFLSLNSQDPISKLIDLAPDFVEKIQTAFMKSKDDENTSIDISVTQ